MGVCFAYIYMSVLCEYLVCLEATGGHWIPWKAQMDVSHHVVPES